MAAREDEDGAMCTEQTKTSTLRGWLRDPMIRLVMESDGVTEEEMIALVRRVSAAVASRGPALTASAPWRTLEQSCAW